MAGPEAPAAAALHDPGADGSATRPSGEAGLRALAAYGVHALVTLILIVGVDAAGYGSGEDDGFYYPVENLALVLGYGVLVAATLVAARALGPVADVLALRRVPVRRTLALIVPTYLLVTLLNVAVFQPLFDTSAAQDITPGAYPGGADAALGVALTVLVFAVGAPLAEELFFRGLVHRALGASAAGLAGWLGVVIGALVFAVIHLQPGAIPALFALGLALGALRRATGSIWPAIGLHALNNAAATVAVFAAAWS